MFNPFSIEGNTILVTGATSGIGRATALICAKMGARVIAVGRNEEALQSLHTELEGEDHICQSIDLCDETLMKEFVQNVPSVDGVAFCAGMASMNPFQFVSDEEMNEVFGINFFAPVKLVRQLLSAKKLNKGGSIVFVSSVDGSKIVHAGNSVYSASKNALVGMSRNMAIDLIGKKVRVNCVLPGTTDTPLIRTANVDEEMLAEKAKSMPMKRFATPDEIANTIVFLLSDASSYVTGTEVTVDGGYSIV